MQTRRSMEISDTFTLFFRFENKRKHQFGTRKLSKYRFSSVSLGNYQKFMFGLTEPILWIQLVAEGSPSKRRGLGVAITRARYHFVEGSASDLLRAEASVESRKWFCAIEETVVFNQRNSSVHSKELLCLIKGL